MAASRWDAIASGEVVIPINAELGFTIEPSSDPAAGIVYTWTVPSALCNSAGNLQGGMLAAFADSVLGGAASAYLAADQYPALAEMKISILRPAPAGMELTGKGRVLKAGKKILFVEAEVWGGDELIAKASGTEVPSPL
ncbi:MAG: PaaI family thioesterase [Actinomycetota bacterium]